MGEESGEIDQEGHALRALLVRFLIEASPDDPRLTEVLTAIDQVVRLAREGQELASLKADVGRMRKAIEDAAQPQLVQRIEALLTHSDSQLITHIQASEGRSLQKLGKLEALVNELTRRVQSLEAQVQKLSAGRV